ncbi:MULTISPECIES: YbjN domain-containing protein [unclassified Novosphingobium]|uniref:YbjN domain-containing protein n=1 Tax=unclassified Novosphingobium TaxID=2644732 RepID=UPI00135A08BE|nr:MULTISPECIES: YbjN domain-containing protein [unclassified Novosphingobium]
MDQPDADHSDLIAADDLDVTCLSALLDDAGIDHESGGEEGAIYVTGLAFPFWLTLGEADEGVHLFSHWMLRDQADGIEALRFVNALNCETLMVQFSLPEPGRAVWGHYWLSCRHGLTIAPFLRSLHRFAGSFAKAVAQGRALDLLRAPGKAAVEAGASGDVLH